MGVRRRGQVVIDHSAWGRETESDPTDESNRVGTELRGGREFGDVTQHYVLITVSKMSDDSSARRSTEQYYCRQARVLIVLLQRDRAGS